MHGGIVRVQCSVILGVRVRMRMMPRAAPCASVPMRIAHGTGLKHGTD